jgi:hypothetical protein
VTPGDIPLELRPVRRLSRHERPEDERTICVPARYLLPDDTADALAAGGTVHHAYRPSAWEWAKAHRWLCLALVLIPGPAVLIVLEILAPW